MSSEKASDVPAEAKSLDSAGLPSSTESLRPASSASSGGEAAAVQPVIGISQRVHTGPKKKKDLGTTGMYSLCVSTCILCFRHVQPVLFLVRLRPRNPHDGDYHHPRSRHHIWILLQEVLIYTAPNKHKNRHYFLVKQQLLLSLCLRMLESSGCSFESAQAECQYELSTHPVWTTC